MRSVSPSLTYCLVAIIILTPCFSVQTPAQGPQSHGAKSKAASASTTETTEPVSEMRAAIERYTVDRGSLQRSYPVATSPARRERVPKHYSDWLASLLKVDFDSMSQDGKIDYILFKNHLEYELRPLDIQARQLDEIQPLLPFAKTIIDFEEARRRMEPVDSAKIAATLTELKKQVDERRRTVELSLRAERGGDPAASREALRINKPVPNRTVGAINGLRN